MWRFGIELQHRDVSLQGRLSGFHSTVAGYSTCVELITLWFKSVLLSLNSCQL